jgi:hypothetical protein
METKKTEEAEVCCASCGITELDDIKLEECNGGCDLVKYCSDKCQGNHREQHEEDCKQRKAELHDRELFEQPDESYVGECPVCFLPLSLDLQKSSFHSCCCKISCLGCDYANFKSSGKDNCPFCREPVLIGEEENNKRVMERVKANDPNALTQMGIRRHVEGDYETAFEYFREAAELGDADAHCNLGNSYHQGQEVFKNEEKAVYHWENAAIGGHPDARHNLGCKEENKGNFERATKHLIIAAKLGLEVSMKVHWKYCSVGNITKEDLDATLRAHKAAIDATKSQQRDAAEAEFRQLAASR